MALTAAREAHEILQEKELKDAQRREAMQYANHLKALMGKLGVDESVRNAQFKAEEDAEWAKREAGWKREEDQRQRLWARVHEERQNQLREKGMLFKLRIKILSGLLNQLVHHWCLTFVELFQCNCLRFGSLLHMRLPRDRASYTLYSRLSVSAIVFAHIAVLDHQA